MTVYWRDGLAHFLDVLDGDLLLFAAMLPKVLAGCLIGGFVALLLPREQVARWVGHESGMTGLLIAMAFGFILPGGPFTDLSDCRRVPADRRRCRNGGGVHRQLDADRLRRALLVWELPFFGADFVLWRIVAALPLPILAGVLARIAVRAGFPLTAPDEGPRKEP